MKKPYIALFAGLITYSASYAQNTSVNQPAIGYNVTSDAFTYKGNSVGHYSLGWYHEQTNQPPIAYFAGFDGVKLFTQGQLRFLWMVTVVWELEHKRHILNFI